MTSRWNIRERSAHAGVEHHHSPYAANRALLILNAHEIKCGREAKYYIDPPIHLESDIQEFDLPCWVLEVLGCAK
jgi:hypothetical protein